MEVDLGRSVITNFLLAIYLAVRDIEGIEHWCLTIVLVTTLLVKELDDNEYFDQFFEQDRSFDSGSVDVSVAKVMSSFPGALSNREIVNRVTATLKKYNYGRTSLLATSLCCDEVNRDLEKEFIHAYGDNFSMGGLAGFAFGGVTSFGAMAHHIPQNGSCLIIYGPHVGVDSDGNVGRINRRGRVKPGACCGSAAAAAGYVGKVREGAPRAPRPTRALDAQQYFVGNMLLPHAERLARAGDPNAELPMALFEVQDELMLKIVLKGCQEVGGDGKIALLGGIQINTPGGASDYFLPKKFEIRNNKGQLLENLMWAQTPQSMCPPCK